MTNTAIKVSRLTKVYKLYDKPIDRIKESLHPLKKQYHKDFYALNDVSFEIKKGETVGIIGKNGTGKSTLLKIITGVLTPTSGDVHVHGRIASLLELGAGFNPNMTGFDNIYFNGMVMGFSEKEIDNKLDDIINFADIGEFIYQPVKSYSSGMFARLAFSVAVSVEPDILVVDEALSVGDMFFVEKCICKINEIIKKNNCTLIFVSHDLTIMRRSTNRCIWMENGTIKQDDKSLVILDNYANEEDHIVSFSDNSNLNNISSEFLWKQYKSRFGTGKVKISKISLNSEVLNFSDTKTLVTNEDVSIQVIWSHSQNINIPITFSIAFFDEDGNNCFGISPIFKGVHISINDKNIECIIKKLPLLRGKYSLSVGIWDEKIIVPYDLHERVYDINIISDKFPEDGKFLPKYEFRKNYD